jgi:reverse gyrase
MGNVEEIFGDPERFFKQIIGFTPYSYQKEFIDMFVDNQFTAAKWCRQSGKTYIICALLLWYAVSHPECQIGVVGPSYRQTKRILQKIAAFTHNSQLA